MTTNTLLRGFFFATFCILSSLQLSAEVRLAKIFSDHMILQREVEVPVWGWADKREKINLSFAGQNHSIRADKNGKWLIKLAPLAAGGPYEMKISGKNDIVIKDILVGEVWICSGQSNMEWPLSQVNNTPLELANANFPNIRHVKVPRNVSPDPNEELEGEIEWKLCTPKNAPAFTAVGYFFGRKLHQELNVPIGLINTSWGGTEVEAWTSKEAIATVGDFDDQLRDLAAIDVGTYKEAQLTKLRKVLKGPLSHEIEIRKGIPAWAMKNISNEGWNEIKVPALWEDEGLKEVDGILWFRKKFSLDEDWDGKEAALTLGPIDDRDETYVNGVLVGKTSVYNEPRMYEVPEGILTAGENVIAIRINDTGGGGGIYGQAEDLLLSREGEQILLAGIWKYKPEKVTVSTNLRPNDYASLLYNSMIHPLIPFGIKGAIWYQGESNAGRAYQYRSIFPLMINDWRQRWGIGDFPFLFVQLANFMEAKEQPEESAWAELREAQDMTLSLPNTGMASAIDIGEADDIHPRNKQDVGKRLALSALKIAYQKDIIHSGPSYQSMEKQGNSIILTFKHIGDRLMAKDKYGYLKGFAIAGEDKKFHWAKARIISKDKVEVFSEMVEKPVSVRYAWADNPDDANLYNNAGLPANPFRTDQWPGLTVGKK